MIGLLIYLAFAGAMLLAPVLGIWPPVQWSGRRCFNSVLGIEMLPRGHQKYGPLSGRYRPIYAQELVEWWLAWAVALVAVAPIAGALCLLDPMAGAGAILIAVLAWTWRNGDWGRAQLEYVGHAAEWIVADRAGLPDYAERDVAQRLQRGYVVFRGMTTEAVAVALRRRRGIARLLVALLALNIRRA